MGRDSFLGINLDWTAIIVNSKKVIKELYKQIKLLKLIFEKR
jgi:hypothetical protein